MEHETDQGPPDEEMLALVDDFVAESTETLAEVVPLILTLEAADADEGALQDTIGRVFRLFHSMKGSAGYLGFALIEKVTHRAESVLDKLRNHPDRLTPAYVDIICAAMDFVQELIHAVQVEKSDASLRGREELIVTRLEQALAALDRPAGHALSPAEVEEAAQPPTLGAELLGLFATEGVEQLETAEEALVALESAPTATENIEAAFRMIHSFKGNCGFAGLRDMEQIAHRLEDLLDAMRCGELQVTSRRVEVLLKTLDVLKAAVQGLERQEWAVPQKSAVLSRIDAVSGKHDEASAATASPRIGDLLIAQGAISEEDLEEALEWQNKPIGEILVDLKKVDPATVQAALGEQSRVATPSTDARTDTAAASRSIRVDVQKLDALLNQVGELITASALVGRFQRECGEVSETLQRATSQLERVTRGLHDTAMAMRMVPLGPTFRKMVRLVRDVSRKVGKKTELILIGEDTEVDKTVIETIADPLVHIVRNAVDHGIELPQVREAAGKPAGGQIRIQAKHQGGEVWIIVSDDGAGIDPARIIAVAKAKGILPEGSTDLSPQAAYQLMFEPGFSTAATVSDISGRGVGMDVVKRNIEGIRGRIEIESVLGHGSTFTIRLPLTLAIIDAMILRTGRSIYAIPLLSVRETLCARPDQVIRTPDGARVVRIRNRVFPILRLDQAHGITGRAREVHEGTLVVVQEANSEFCLFVDEILGQQQLVIKALEGYLGTPGGVSGCSILGGNEICLILDIDELARTQRGRRPEEGRCDSVGRSGTEVASKRASVLASVA